MLSSQYGYLKGTDYGPQWSFAERYDESDIVYDRNGNLKNLTRYHGDYNKIDQLGYKNWTGNRLGRVEDYTGDTSPVGFKDKDNAGGNDYTYDVNGNMTSDYNKSITSITYNYLNLPTVITVTGKGTVTYSYDAAGNKLQKTTVTTAPVKTTNYYYAGNYIYRNDTLEFISHGEGRLRPVRIDTTQAISMANLKYIYDYFLKDHLGSVRSVLTTEQQQDVYAATMETAASTKENALFSNIATTVAQKLAGMTTDNNNQKASKLNGAVNNPLNKRVGPAIVLKVMAGDTVSLSTWSWYTGPVQAPASGTGIGPILNDLAPLLQAGVAAAGGSKGGTIPNIVTDPLLSADVQTLLNQQSNYVSTRPKAYLNWMVVDEDFSAVTGSTNHVGATQIPACVTGDTLKQTVGLTNMVVRRNGWIYVYVSNESSQDVYFDNLVVNLKHGPLIEQKDYYAFGMEIPSLNTQALKQNYNENRQKYNAGSELQNKEFNDGSGLELYDFNARTYDPQLGRFIQLDGLSYLENDNSPFAYANNNPVLFNDPSGLLADSSHPQILAEVTVSAKRPLDTQNGQVLPSRSALSDMWDGNRAWKAFPGSKFTYAVDHRGYIIPNKSVPNQLLFNPPIGLSPLNLKAVFNIKNFIKGRYVIYKGVKDGLDYVGKARGALQLRYSSAKIQEMGIQVIDGLDNLPNNATALGVEQLIIDLNGGMAAQERES